MKVWVIMGNDYPQEVWDNEVTAEGRVKVLEAEDKVRDARRIYYRAYEFDVNQPART